MSILVLNCGSSSLRFRLTGDGERRLASGIVERIGGQALVRVRAGDGEPERRVTPLRDHRAAIDHVLRWLLGSEAGGGALDDAGAIAAVGHRVVHGGERFREPVIIDRDVLDGIEECVELAPLHNPANLAGIRAATSLLGDALPQVAVFDTAFHATMPEASYVYAIPYQYYRRHRVRRYGFHGSSHAWLAERYAELSGVAHGEVNVITLHLGNGCSACAIRGGRSFATSMGFTPLAGLVMGTRSGDVDPSLVEFLMLKEGLQVHDLDALLNRHSGLLGISGLTGDMRELLAEEAEHHDRRVRLAIDVFCRRIVHYVGGYFAEMGGADALVFSGGIGENAPEIRRRVCDGLAALGVELDPARNAEPDGDGPLADGGRLRPWLIATDEERLIARETARVVAERAVSGHAERAR